MNGDITCGDCSAPMQEYDIYDRDTHEVVGTETVCPREWREAHP